MTRELDELDLDCVTYHCKFWGGIGEEKCKIGMTPYRHSECCERYRPFAPSTYDGLQLDLKVIE